MTNYNYAPKNIMIAPATLSDNCVSIIWDKPNINNSISGYAVYLDEKQITILHQSKTHYTFKNLLPNHSYRVSIISVIVTDDTSTNNKREISFTTFNESTLIDVTLPPYNISSNSKNVETNKLQSAIDNCPIGGTVYIPIGITVLSGAINLKSDMTFKIDGTLIGSKNPSDYLSKTSNTEYVDSDGLVLSRYEGWEMFCYRSLINAGYLDSKNRTTPNCKNIRITGSGQIIGGGEELGIKMRENYSDKLKYPKYVSDGIGGRRVRGRLISLIQCFNAHISDLTISNSPSWTIHMLYCDTITTNGLTINSKGIDNGDGWDPDSSKNLMIFDTNFDTSDDCIAIKSGKNPEGNAINIPTKNVKIFNVTMVAGHGIAIGSEQSGGVNNIVIHDCNIQHTQSGLELKASNSRGGFIKDIFMSDCIINRFFAHSVDYNNDGSNSPTLPMLSNISINNTIINGSDKLIELIGFKQHELINSIKNVSFNSVTLGNKDHVSTIKMKYCNTVTFNNVKYANIDKITEQIDLDSVINYQKQFI